MASDTNTGRQQGTQQGNQQGNQREQKNPQGTSSGSGSQSNAAQQSQKFADHAAQRSAGTGNEGSRIGSFSNNPDPSDRNADKEGNNQPNRMQSPDTMKVGKNNEQQGNEQRRKAS